MAYAILRHRLLDIEVVIKRTVVYSTATALLTGLFVSLILVSDQLFRGITGYSSLWAGVIGAFVIALVFQPLRELIQKAVDKIFFRARYDYQYILGKYSNALAQPMTDLDRFSRLAPYLLVKAMKLSGASFMVLDRESHRYLIRAGVRDAEKMVGLSVSESSPLVKELIARRGSLSLEEVQSQKEESIVAEMKALGAALVIPSISESEYFGKPTLLSTINLGKKLSDQNFSREDVEFLRTLANQATINIEYAFIFEELRKNQEQVIRSEKLAAIGTTTAGIAHELKNPLTYINTLAQVLPQKWDDPEFRKSVDNILISEAQRMKLIVEGLLDYSRSKELTLKPLDVKEVIEKTIALLVYDIRKNKVDFKAEYNHGEAKASADPNRLIQVFMNLVSNAVQAMGEKGGELLISTEADSNSVKVSVKDTGPGIPPEKLEKIFDPFYSTKESGTGLGLAITKKIIEEHKGLIEVNSLVGAGTVFKVSLPRA